MPPLYGRLAALYRHPVKGFTPEALTSARLEAGLCFPGDRLYAVEDGPSGFDPADPRHIPKMRFAVLAKIPEVALAHTRYNDETGELSVTAPGHEPLRAMMGNATGRDAFADWLQGFLAGHATGTLKVLHAPGDHRFMDSRSGFVSILNLASVRDLEEKVDKPLDPLRFRANLHVEGWPAWAENTLIGADITVGGIRLKATKPIGRCRAIHVDPYRGAEDIDLVSQLFNHFGHTITGLYASVTGGGRIEIGDAVEIAA